jgi:hypothetical protein
VPLSRSVARDVNVLQLAATVIPETNWTECWTPSEHRISSAGGLPKYFPALLGRCCPVLRVTRYGICPKLITMTTKLSLRNVLRVARQPAKDRGEGMG